MGQYSYSRPSSSEASGYPEVSSDQRRVKRFGPYVHGIPQKCGCGLAVVSQTSSTELNPGRIFYGCKNYKDGGYHLFKWWDEAMAEEVQDLKRITAEQGGCIHRIRNGDSVLEAVKGCVELKNWILLVFIILTAMILFLCLSKCKTC